MFSQLCESNAEYQLIKIESVLLNIRSQYIFLPDLTKPLRVTHLGVWINNDLLFTNIRVKYVEAGCAMGNPSCILLKS